MPKPCLEAWKGALSLIPSLWTRFPAAWSIDLQGRRGFHLTLTTPISFSQGGQSISSSEGAGLKAKRLSAAQQARSKAMDEAVSLGRLWPCHRVVKVDGRSTEVFSLKSSAGHSALQVLILPGNPGSAGYYEAYIAFLHVALQGRADIHAVSHLGHASNKQARQHRKQAFSLGEQIEHKVAYIQQHLSGVQSAPIAIIGHSIGAYMALKVTKQVQALSASSATPQVVKVLAVFPFFQVDLSNRQQKMMHTLTRVPRVMGVVGAILGALLLAFQRWLVNWWGGGLEDYAENATVGLLNYHTIKNGFYLGHTEFRDLAGPVDWQQLADLGEKVAVICNPHDTWFSKRSWEQMWLKLPQVKAYMEEAQRHDFCVSRELSASLAQKSAELLQGLLA
ncbi:hypothetical protein WJX79_000653 [Trebouxia sp. C0005]